MRIFSACQLLRKGFFFLLATGDFDSHNAYSALSNELNIPFINWASSHDTSSFEVSVYPPMEEIMADLIISKGWTDYAYLYSDDEGVVQRRHLCYIFTDALIFAGPFRSMHIDQYVQAKRHKASGVLLQQLPDPFEGDDLQEYFLKFKEDGRNRVIIDTHGHVLHGVMNALKNIAKQLINTHFIIASYVRKN